MRIRIYTDSASDITQQELSNYQVGLFPMPLMCDDVTYIDDKTIPTDTFWEMMLDGKTIKTSQPSPESFIQAFEQARQAGEAVICVLISSVLSGTYQGAMTARSIVGYDRVYIVDAQGAAATVAEKMLVFRACQLRDQGMSAEEIVQDLEHFRSRIRLLACIDTLEYLARGGRLSKTSANLGGLMKVKPIITFSEINGEIKVVKKVIGGQRAMKEMCTKTLGCPVETAFPVIPLYAYDSGNCKKFMSLLAENGFSGNAKEPESIGATIGAYIGPGGYGIVYVEAEK